MNKPSTLFCPQWNLSDHACENSVPIMFASTSAKGGKNTQMSTPNTIHIFSAKSGLAFFRQQTISKPPVHEPHLRPVHSIVGSFNNSLTLPPFTSPLKATKNPLQLHVFTSKLKNSSRRCCSARKCEQEREEHRDCSTVR